MHCTNILFDFFTGKDDITGCLSIYLIIVRKYILYYLEPIQIVNKYRANQKGYVLSMKNSWARRKTCRSLKVNGTLQWTVNSSVKSRGVNPIFTQKLDPSVPVVLMDFTVCFPPEAWVA